jgi:hypothetical protein
MKLFKSLLVAPATLGLLAPMSATANQINLAGVSAYSSSEEIQNISEFNAAKEIAVTNSRVDGLEAKLNNFEAGAFSETTTASFSADMAIGATDGIIHAEAVQALYGFQIDLNTSFTGEDSLDVSIDAGNGGNGLSELDLNEGSSDDVLTVDGVSYTFPLGDKTTVFVGDNMDGSTLYSTACVYGGPTNTLDDCGNASSAMAAGFGTAAGASFDIGNGFTAAIGYETQGSAATGVLTKESADAFGGQLTYTADSYGASVTYANIESTTASGTVIAGEDVTYWGLNGYWTPSESGSMPSISLGYEMGDPEKAGEEDTTHYFVGLQWDEVGPGTFGAAIGTTGHTAESATEYMMYEAFYAYDVNDGMTVTPLVYVKETSGTEDETGIMVKTSFSF